MVCDDGYLFIFNWPVRYMPDFFPFTGFKREARIARDKLETITIGPYRKARNRIVSIAPSLGFY